MPVKTITIDLEAYDILARGKRPGQSFSRLIKERLGRRMTGADLRDLVARTAVSAATLNGIERQIRARRRDRARRPRG